MINWVMEAFRKVGFRNGLGFCVLSVFVGLLGGLSSVVFRLLLDFFYGFFIVCPQRLLPVIGLESLGWVPFLVSNLVGGLLVGI